MSSFPGFWSVDCEVDTLGLHHTATNREEPPPSDRQESALEVGQANKWSLPEDKLLVLFWLNKF